MQARIGQKEAYRRPGAQQAGIEVTIGRIVRRHNRRHTQTGHHHFLAQAFSAVTGNRVRHFMRDDRRQSGIILRDRQQAGIDGHLATRQAKGIQGLVVVDHLEFPLVIVAPGRRGNTLADTLRIMAEMVGGIEVKADAMERAALKGYATATDLADYLVKKGLPFRDAHEAVGHAVKAAEQKGVDLPQLTLDELKAFCPQVENDVFSVLTVTGSLASRNHIGGTAPEQVRAAIQRARTRLKLP